MKSSPKQGKNETNDINNGTNSPLGCQEITAEQILHVISHPIFQNSGLYINEDLMPNKQKLAYLARKMKREKKIYSTFTCDGEVYIKETELSEPKVFTEEFIKIHSQQNENAEVFLSCQNSNSSI